MLIALVLTVKRQKSTLEINQRPESITDDQKTENLKANDQCPMKLEVIYGKFGK